MIANVKIVSAIGRDEIEALDDLKATNQIITSSLQKELLLLRAKAKNLTTDYEQQKSHLVDALLAKDKLRQELAAMNEGKDSAGEETNVALQSLKEVSHTIGSPLKNNFRHCSISPPIPPRIHLSNLVFPEWSRPRALLKLMRSIRLHFSATQLAP